MPVGVIREQGRHIANLHYVVSWARILLARGTSLFSWIGTLEATTCPWNGRSLKGRPSRRTGVSLYGAEPS